MLTVGTYKTRGGVDAVIVAVVDGFAIGYRVSEGPIGTTTWDANSGSYFSDGSEDSWDIIDTKPLIKFEKWATLYREANGGYYIDLHNSLSDAKSVVSAGKVAITKIAIDCVEGENLD